MKVLTIVISEKRYKELQYDIDDIIDTYDHFGEFVELADSPSEYLAVVDEVNVLFGKEHGGISPTSHRLEPHSSKESEETK